MTGRRSFSVMALLVVALSASADAAWPSPYPPRLLVQWRIIATPDQESANAAAFPFETTISLGTRLIDSYFTGSGCMVGPFPSPLLSMRSDQGTAFYFEATSRTQNGAAMTW